MQTQSVISAGIARKLRLHVSGSAVFLFGLSATVAVLVAPFLAYQILRITSPASIDYNEGWNVFHASLLAERGILYTSFDDIPVIPVDYPPLSFVIVNAAGYLTGSLLIAGRLVSLLSFLGVAVLIFKTAKLLTQSTTASVIAGLLWLSLVVRLAGPYVGTNDPQMLGHLLSTAALYLFCRWDGRFTPTRIVAVATICVIALFTKHSLLAVPTALAIVLLFSDQHNFVRFAVAGIILGSLMLALNLLWSGAPALTNLSETVPATSHVLLMTEYKRLFLERGLWVLALPVAAVWIFERRNNLLPAYLAASAALGTNAMRGIGCDINHLFDLFIAAALCLGVCAAIFIKYCNRPRGRHDHGGRWRPLLGSLSLFAISAAVFVNEFTVARFVSSDGVLEYSTVATIRSCQAVMLLGGVVTALFRRRLIAWLRPFSLARGATVFLLMIVLAGGFLPVARHYTKDRAALDYAKLKTAEQRYIADVHRLQSISGPALFEDILLGFDAGKDFLFDPFLGATLMSRGRLPEEILIRRIQQREFSAIVLWIKLPEALGKPRKPMTDPNRNFSERWTDNVLRAIAEYYEPDFGEGTESSFFYRPRKL